MKTCTKCGVEKPVADYGAHKNTRDKLACECKQCASKRAQIWKRSNRERAKKADARLYRKNCARRKALSARYKKENPDKVNAMKSARKASTIRATPAWADWGLIDATYTMAAAMTRLTGVKYHVDHIVPLRSKLVCGLHVGHNLQLLSASQNCSKSNRFWPDMPQATQHI